MTNPPRTPADLGAVDETAITLETRLNFDIRPIVKIDDAVPQIIEWLS